MITSTLNIDIIDAGGREEIGEGKNKKREGTLKVLWRRCLSFLAFNFFSMVMVVG